MAEYATARSEPPTAHGGIRHGFLAWQEEATADLGERQPPGDDRAHQDLDIAEMVVPRLFRVGLTLQSAAGLASGPAGERLQQAIDELDAIIGDVRAAAYRCQVPGQCGEAGGPGRPDRSGP